MNYYLQKIKNYGKEIQHRKKRLVLACIVFSVLMVFSFRYMYDGLNKHIMIATVLSAVTGLSIVCPRLQKWYLALPMLLVYLAVIPLKMFQRMELPIHDMALIRPGATLANLLIIFLVYAVLLLLFQRVHLALAGGGIFFLIVLLVNYYVVQFRGSMLSPTDLFAVGTAMTVLDNYQLTVSGELWYSILYFCSFIAFGFWCAFPGKGKKYHITVTAISLAYCLFFCGFWNVSGYLEKYELEGHYFNPIDSEKLNGFPLSFGITMREMTMKKPVGYSEKTILQIAGDAADTYQSPVEAGGKPNIIIIMDEAWSDLRVLGNLETNEEYMPFVDSMQENVIKGNTYVEVLGGVTANTEFEVLTGDSLAFFAPSVAPYQLQVNHDMSSLATVLGEQGYRTIAMHPNYSSAWNRDKAYSYLGFDEFIDATKFETELMYERGFVSDQCNFNEIIWRYEHRQEAQPFFLFDVTIQNHADYNGQVDAGINIEKVGDMSAEDAGELNDVSTYINLIKLTDDAFSELVEYFRNVEEPTIICMYGDHQPKLGDDFYNAIFHNRGLSEEEQTALKYITPYVIWANYDVDFTEYGDMSANYLGATVLECAGVELPKYYKYLLQLQKEYSEISHRTIEGIKEEESIIKYQMLEYSQLMEKAYPREVFAIVNR